jgi:hypothetical protein
MWQISTPSFENMQTQLPLRYNNSINPIPLTISMTFTRGNLDINTGVAVEVTASHTVYLIGDNASEFIDIILGNRDSMVLRDLFPTFNHLGNTVNSNNNRNLLPPGDTFSNYADCTLTYVLYRSLFLCPHPL